MPEEVELKLIEFLCVCNIHGEEAVIIVGDETMKKLFFKGWSLCA